MKYTIVTHEWNGTDYDFVTKAESDDLEDITRTFEGIKLSNDCPLIELWENAQDDEGEDKRIAYRD